MYRTLITLLVVVTGAVAAPAQWMFMKADGDSLVRIGVQHIYNVEFEQAEQAFAKVGQMYPEHPVSYFMDAMVDWWRIALDKRRHTYDQQFLNKIDKVLDRCESILQAEPMNVTALFFKGGALGFKGRFHALRHEFIDAATAGKEALAVLEESQKIAPGNHDMMLGTGIYNYYAAAIPEKYPMMKPAMLFVPRGDKTLGLLQLKAAASKARYANIEAQWLIVQTYLDWERVPSKAYDYAKDLHERYPKNPAFEVAYGRCLVSSGELDKMEQVFRTVLLNYMDKRRGYDEYVARDALYYIGMGRMIRKDFDIALKYFYKCDEACRLLDKDGPTDFMIKTNLKVGQIYDMQGKRALAIKQYNKVLNMPDKNDSHKLANLYLETPYGGRAP